jgi:intraflagellar transport protein 52
MSVNNDSVMRSVFYKYLHPKEVFVAEGVLVPDIARKKVTRSALYMPHFAAHPQALTWSLFFLFCLFQNAVQLGGGKKNAVKAVEKAAGSKAGQQPAKVEKLGFVYPYGASLTVQRPSIPLLSSGPTSYPMNRPVSAMWEADTVSEAGGLRGRLVVIGSAEIFGDDWIDKEENTKLCDVLFSWLLQETEIDMTSDRLDSDISDCSPVPNIEALSQILKPCLQGMDDLPRDFTKLFDMSMFRFDVDLIPHTIQVYDTLGVPHEPLTLIPPQFECPLPKLMPATFPPAMREPAPPALDQFDLDEHFAKESPRLAQLTNKCTSGEEDLEYYIAESGEILGVIPNLSFGERSAKHILYYIFKQIVEFKKQDPGKTDNGASGGDGYFGGYNSSPVAYEYDGSFQAASVEAVPTVSAALTHIQHVDLAPMKDSNRGNLQVGYVCFL